MRAKGESRRRNNHAAARYAYAVCGDAAWHVRWRAQWPTRTLTGVVCAGFCAFPTAPIGPRPLLPAPICTRTPWSPDDHRSRVAHRSGARADPVWTTTTLPATVTSNIQHVYRARLLPPPSSSSLLPLLLPAAAVALTHTHTNTHTRARILLARSLPYTRDRF